LIFIWHCAAEYGGMYGGYGGGGGGGYGTAPPVPSGGGYSAPPPQSQSYSQPPPNSGGAAAPPAPPQGTWSDPYSRMVHLAYISEPQVSHIEKKRSGYKFNFTAVDLNFSLEKWIHRKKKMSNLRFKNIFKDFHSGLYWHVVTSAIRCAAGLLS